MQSQTPKPEPSPAEKFRAFAQKVISVPKTEIERREGEYQKRRKAGRAKH
jgi:hypothetical protein